MISATVTGNIGKDAETRAAGQNTVTSFTVASNRKVKGEDTTTWIRMSVWDKRGESLRQYLVKGVKVCAVGELSTREYEGKTYLEMRVSELDFMSSQKRDGGERREQSDHDKDKSNGYQKQSDAGAGDDDLPFAPIGSIG